MTATKEAGYGSLLRKDDDKSSGAAETGVAPSILDANDWLVLQKTRRWCRIAGILYVAVIVCGLTAEVGLRNGLIDGNNAAATVEHVAAHASAIRASLLLDVCMSACDVAISFLLGAILCVSGAPALWALLAMGFRLLQQAILATNLLHLLAATLLLEQQKDDDGDDQVESLAFLFLALHKHGYLLALVFFGISLVVLGVVIWRYGMFAQWMGGLLVVAGIGYVMDSVLALGWADYDGQATPILMLPALVAEVAFTTLLLLQQQTLANTWGVVDATALL